MKTSEDIIQLKKRLYDFMVKGPKSIPALSRLIEIPTSTLMGLFTDWNRIPIKKTQEKIEKFLNDRKL